MIMCKWSVSSCCFASAFVWHVWNLVFIWNLEFEIGILLRLLINVSD